MRAACRTAAAPAAAVGLAALRPPLWSTHVPEEAEPLGGQRCAVRGNRLLSWNKEWPLGVSSALCEQGRVGKRRNAVLATQHRVGLCCWPVKGALMKGDPRVRSLEDLFCHVARAGYDGLEVSFVQFKGLFVKGGFSDSEADGSSEDDRLVSHILELSKKHGIVVLGATYHIMDGREDVAGAPDFSHSDFAEKLSRRMVLDKRLGAGYVNFQVFLPPRYLQTPLAWRDDKEYLQKTLQRCLLLRDLCWQHGLNAYFETHIDRVSEDPVFFARVLAAAKQYGGLESNGDLSHYLYRGWTVGVAVDDVLKTVNHMHVRAARVHGDLSAETLDPCADFAAGGPTRAQWDLILRTGPLSSRTICGEAGPIHLVESTLDQDARLVPMMRAIAAAKDGSMVHLASDFNPFHGAS